MKEAHKYAKLAFKSFLSILSYFEMVSKDEVIENLPVIFALLGVFIMTFIYKGRFWLGGLIVGWLIGILILKFCTNKEA